MVSSGFSINFLPICPSCVPGILQDKRMSSCRATKPHPQICGCLSVLGLLGVYRYHFSCTCNICNIYLYIFVYNILLCLYNYYTIICIRAGGLCLVILSKNLRLSSILKYHLTNFGCTHFLRSHFFCWFWYVTCTSFVAEMFRRGLLRPRGMQTIARLRGSGPYFWSISPTAHSAHLVMRFCSSVAGWYFLQVSTAESDTQRVVWWGAITNAKNSHTCHPISKDMKPGVQNQWSEKSPDRPDRPNQRFVQNRQIIFMEFHGKHGVKHWCQTFHQGSATETSSNQRCDTEKRLVAVGSSWFQGFPTAKKCPRLYLVTSPSLESFCMDSLFWIYFEYPCCFLVDHSVEYNLTRSGEASDCQSFHTYSY